MQSISPKHNIIETFEIKCPHCLKESILSEKDKEFQELKSKGEAVFLCECQEQYHLSIGDIDKIISAKFQKELINDLELINSDAEALEEFVGFDAGKDLQTMSLALIDISKRISNL